MARNITAGLGLTSTLESFGYAHVSSGTLHPADLAEAMYSSIHAYAAPSADLTAWNKEVLAEIPASAWENRNDPYWDTDSAMYVLEEMSDILDGICPEGYWFSSSEGDGADFAIWPVPPEDAD